MNWDTREATLALVARHAGYSGTEPSTSGAGQPLTLATKEHGTIKGFTTLALHIAGTTAKGQQLLGDAADKQTEAQVRAGIGHRLRGRWAARASGHRGSRHRPTGGWTPNRRSCNGSAGATRS